jgi:hypothetical protein
MTATKGRWRLSRSGILHAFTGRAVLSRCGAVRCADTFRGAVADPTTSDFMDCKTCTTIELQR